MEFASERDAFHIRPIVQRQFRDLTCLDSSLVWIALMAVYTVDIQEICGPHIAAFNQP